MRFLVVDDDELSRELVAILLESEGHTVEVVASGAAALERLKHGDPQYRPDVILTDLQMPGLAGAGLAADLRAEIPGAIKILAISGSRPTEETLNGFDGFLLKPFSANDLRAVLENVEPNPVHQGPVSLVATAEESGIDQFPALDEVVYSQLAKSMTAAQLAQMYVLCVSDARRRIDRMIAFAEAADDEAYRKEAHTVKGGCGLIGATELYRLAETAETSGLQPHPGRSETAGINRIKALLQRMYIACDRLERIVGKHM